MRPLPMQMEEGVWQLQVGPAGNPTYSMYVWSRSEMAQETFVSTHATPLPITQAYVATPVTGAPSFETVAQFLTWCCQQVSGSPKLYVMSCQSTYTTGTHQC
jgi:hypothetical protein